MNCDPGLVFTAVGAIATAAAVIVSLCQIRGEKRARAAEFRRCQAEGISSWLQDGVEDSHPEDDSFVWQRVALQNESDAPVYNVVVTCVGNQGAGPASRGEENGGDYPCRSFVGVLPPGEWGTWLPTHGRGMSIVLGSELAFRDARGVSWVRRGNGTLEEISMDPLEFYGISLPCPWGGCERR